MFDSDQPMRDAIAAMRERASQLTAEGRIDEAEAVLDQIAKALADAETRRQVRP